MTTTTDPRTIAPICEAIADPATDRILALVEQQPPPLDVPLRLRTTKPAERASLRWAPPLRNDMKRSHVVGVPLDAPTRVALWHVQAQLSKELGRASSLHVATVLRLTTFCMVEILMVEHPSIPTVEHGKPVDVFSIFLDHGALSDLKDVARGEGQKMVDVIRAGVHYMRAVCDAHGPVLETRVRHFNYEQRKRALRLVHAYLTKIGRPATEEEIVDALTAVPLTEGWPEGQWV